MKRDLAQMKALVRLLAPRVDIITIGNGPFIDSHDKGPELVDYYARMARAAFAAAPRKRRKADFYMGSINQEPHPNWSPKVVDKYFEFVHDNHTELRGVDLHPHVRDVKAVQAFVDRANKGLHRSQDFIATEFSLIHHWKQYNGIAIDPRFARKWRKEGIQKDWKMHHFYRHVHKKPVPQECWDDFGSYHKWYGSNVDFLTQAFNIMNRSGRLRVATYGITQVLPAKLDEVDFGAKDYKPWFLNSVFAPVTVRTGKDGTQFKKLPHGHTAAIGGTSRIP